MKKTSTRVPISAQCVRYRTTLETEPCSPGTQQAIIEQYRLLETIVERPDIITCGPSHFQTLTVFHNGVAWIAEAEATIEKEFGG